MASRVRPHAAPTVVRNHPVVPARVHGNGGLGAPDAADEYEYENGGWSWKAWAVMLLGATLLAIAATCLAMPL